MRYLWVIPHNFCFILCIGWGRLLRIGSWCSMPTYGDRHQAGIACWDNLISNGHSLPSSPFIVGEFAQLSAQLGWDLVFVEIVRVINAPPNNSQLKRSEKYKRDWWKMGSWPPLANEAWDRQRMADGQGGFLSKRKYFPQSRIYFLGHRIFLLESRIYFLNLGYIFLDVGYFYLNLGYLFDLGLTQSKICLALAKLARLTVIWICD